MTTLDQIANKHKTDKGSWHHGYCNNYEKHLAPLRDKPILLIEAGIGGYNRPGHGGAGLKMWAEYFSRGRVVGFDIHDKGFLDGGNICTAIGSQNDRAFLEGLIEKVGRPDVFVDDASHMNALTIETFKIAFPLLKPGGIYIIEDIETSWWEEHGFDGCKDRHNLNAETTINFARRLLDCVNEKHLPSKAEYPIESMHFYQNIVIFHKKANQ